MKNTIMLICTSLLLCSCATADNRPLMRELMKHPNQGQVPDDLYRAYDALVKAIETGDQVEIKKHCLPHAITFTTEPRPEKGQEFGQDMNMAFLEKGFHKYIQNVANVSEEVIAIRTGSTHMSFVKTKSGKWMLYRYFDKPIA